MKWYKHDTKSHTDEKIMMLMDLHGLAGYGFYCVILELVAEKVDRDSLKPEISLTLSVLKRITGLYHTNLVLKYLQSLADLRLISLRSSGDLRPISNNLVTISCPNLLKRLDNWTKRSVVTTELLLPKNKKENKNKKEKENKTFGFPQTNEKPDRNNKPPWTPPPGKLNNLVKCTAENIK